MLDYVQLDSHCIAQAAFSITMTMPHSFGQGAKGRSHSSRPNGLELPPLRPRGRFGCHSPGAQSELFGVGNSHCPSQVSACHGVRLYLTLKKHVHDLAAMDSFHPFRG